MSNVTISGLGDFLLGKSAVIPNLFFKWKLNYPSLSTINIWTGINTFLSPNILKFYIIIIPVTLFFLSLS